MISGAGAICCSLGSCPDATLSLRAGDCQNDICCGLNSCWNANFSSNGPIRSLSCEGDACRRATASSLMGDLFCNTTTGPVCQDFEGEFRDIVPAQHSITCTGRDACNRASFTFSGAGANVSIKCDSEDSSRFGGACADTVVDVVASNVCLEVICSDKLPDTCEGMKINIHDPTSKCFYQGPAVFNPIRHFAVPALPPAQSRRRTFVALGLMVMA
ncbi:unnamed protein product [Durusdinium trenchii]|uniref:Uncharacterized protein n=2 Tax=Durusdinium trenchii TaxID=1381693 RepID=A0ABP0QUP9_9DINO